MFSFIRFQRMKENILCAATQAKVRRLIPAWVCLFRGLTVFVSRSLLLQSSLFIGIIFFNKIHLFLQTALGGLQCTQELSKKPTK